MTLLITGASQWETSLPSIGLDRDLASSEIEMKTERDQGIVGLAPEIEAGLEGFDDVLNRCDRGRRELVEHRGPAGTSGQMFAQLAQVVRHVRVSVALHQGQHRGDIEVGRIEIVDGMPASFVPMADEVGQQTRIPR